MTQSRRTFLKTGAALGAAALVRPHDAFATSENARAITAPLSQFGYGDVELLEGPMREQFDRNHAFYRSLDEDSLLKPFRQRAGLPAPGEDMGGWYSWAPLSDIDARPNNGFCSRTQFRAIFVWAFAILCGNGRQGNAGESAAAGAADLLRQSRRTSGTTIGFRHISTTRFRSA